MEKGVSLVFRASAKSVVLSVSLPNRPTRVSPKKDKPLLDGTIPLRVSLLGLNQIGGIVDSTVTQVAMGPNPVPPVKMPIPTQIVRLNWVVHLPQNGTIGFDPQPTKANQQTVHHGQDQLEAVAADPKISLGLRASREM